MVLIAFSTQTKQFYYHAVPSLWCIVIHSFAKILHVHVGTLYIHVYTCMYLATILAPSVDADSFTTLTASSGLLSWSKYTLDNN